MYVIFGQKNGFPDPLPIASLNGTNGIEIDQTCSGGGPLTASFGDVNGDGIQDIITYNVGNGTPSGCGMIIFGGPGPWPAQTTGPILIAAGTAVSTVIQGLSDSWTVNSITTGDINGDGIDDIVYGFPEAYYPGVQSIVDVVFGHRGSWASGFATSYFNGITGVTYTGSIAGGDCFGASAAIGDVNRDGINDLIIGDGFYQGDGPDGSGTIYTIFGKRSGWPTTPTQASTLMDGHQGFVMTSDYYSFGTSIAVGDFNGDGIKDILAATPWGGGNVSIIWGKACGNDCPPHIWQFASDGTPGTPNVEDGVTGSEIGGIGGVNGWVGQNAFLGSPSLAAGDINGDGIDDIVIGQPENNNIWDYSGGSLLVAFGHSGPWPNDWLFYPSNVGVAPSTVQNGVTGFEVDGDPAKDNFGFGVAVGDINGDGIKDIVVGSPSSIHTGSRAGAAYVIYGRKRGWWPTALSTDQM